MIEENEILVTGGSGLLGSEIKKLIPNAYFPSHAEFCVPDYASMWCYISGLGIKTLFHAAASTSPPKIDTNPEDGLIVNIEGTSAVVKLCMEFGLRLIYMSTDYVFKGWYGNYVERDDMNPINKYAWSKLGGECAVRMYDNSLIIRTSFGENKFPYEKAFVDQWTSKQTVSVIAKKIVRIIKEKPDLTGVIHIGGERKTVYEYAKESKPDVGILKRNEVDFNVPKDTSLDCSKYRELFGEE